MSKRRLTRKQKKKRKSTAAQQVRQKTADRRELRDIQQGIDYNSMSETELLAHQQIVLQKATQIQAALAKFSPNWKPKALPSWFETADRTLEEDVTKLNQLVSEAKAHLGHRCENDYGREAYEAIQTKLFGFIVDKEAIRTAGLAEPVAAATAEEEE